MKSAQFSRFEENFRPVWRFWQLWLSKMRFGQNVLRMTWNERFVQCSRKAHSFPVLERFWRQCDDFDNFDSQKCDLPKTCCAWPETSVLYNFHEKRTVFPFWRAFQASVTILTTLTLKNAIWPKRAAHDLKKPVLYNFHGKRTVSSFWREFQASVTILTTLPLKNAIWPKRAAHDLKRAFCTIFMKSALFFRLKRIWDKSSDFEKFDPDKCDLGKTSCAWPETSSSKRGNSALSMKIVQNGLFTILTTLTVKNANWPKRVKVVKIVTLAWNSLQNGKTVRFP